MDLSPAPPPVAIDTLSPVGYPPSPSAYPPTAYPQFYGQISSSPSAYPTPAGYSYPSAYPPGYGPPPSSTAYPQVEDKNKIWYPAVIVYTILVVIWLIGAIVSNAPPTTKLFNVVFGLIWAFAFWVLILMLSRKGYTGWAMFIALFGLIVWGILILLALFGFLLFEGNPLTW